MRNAEKGIRFIDSGYNDLFRIPDGGKILVTDPMGEKKEYTCRFIDPYHVEVGSGAFCLYHICEFAERMEQNGCKVEPFDAIPGEERKIQIYQLKNIPQNSDIMFMGLDSVRSITGRDVDFAKYERVYEERFPAGRDLESVYERFNVDIPADYKGRALSVGDIIVVSDGKNEDAYFVDTIGFAQIPCPKDRDRLIERAADIQYSEERTLHTEKKQAGKAKHAASVRKKTQPGLE